MSKSLDKIPLNKKRNRTISFEKDDENIDNAKKIKSAETKKEKTINIPFMAFINSDNKIENSNEEKLVGEDLIIESRKEKAIKIIASISENNDDELEKIKKSLKYDNTNKYNIYRLLKYYKDKNDHNKFDETIRMYKYCITKKMKINDIDVDLNKLYTIKEPIEEFEELDGHEKNEKEVKDLRNSFVSIYNNYYHISFYLTKYEKILKSDEFKEIISIKYEIQDKDSSSYILNFEEDKKTKILSNYRNIKKKDIEYLLGNINNFLYRYLYIKSFTYFQPNQPISYEQNLTLYYNYIIFSIFELTIEVIESKNKVIFKLPQLYIYNNLRKFHNILFDEFFDKKEPMNKTMDCLLQFLLLVLSVNVKHSWGKKYSKLIHLSKIDTFLTQSSMNDFIKHFNEDFSATNIEFNKDKIQLFYYNDRIKDIIEIKLTDMWNKIFDNFEYLNWIWEGLKFEEFQNTNFFTKNDIKYLKYLVKKILSSELFENIFKNFSDIEYVADYYFKEHKNIEDYINRIIFLPFNKTDIYRIAITDRRILSVFISGLPEKNIKDIEEYRIYRIVELSLRIIALGCHEPCHFIKAVYSLLTEGKISRNTSNIDINGEGGYYLEEILFGWILNKENPLDLSNLLKENTICENEAIKNKKIDLITALTLLNPDIYQTNLDNFRKRIFGITKNDLNKFKIISSDSTYIEYISSIIDIEKINNIDVKKNDYSINAAMCCETGYFLEYISDNHNL